MKIAADCLAKMLAYAQLCDAEISGFAQVRVENGQDFRISDPDIISQTVTGGSADIAAADMADYLQQCLLVGRDINVRRGWWHSHSDMPPFMSAIDVATMQKDLLAYAPWWVAVVLNRRGELKAWLAISEPVFALLPLEVEICLAPAENEVLRAEIVEKVKRGREEYDYGYNRGYYSHRVSDDGNGNGRERHAARAIVVAEREHGAAAFSGGGHDRA